MKKFNNKSIFGLSVLFGIALVLVYCGYQRWMRLSPSPRPSPVSISRLAADVWVSGQITPSLVPYIELRGFAAVIDLRPDGEAWDQPPAAEIEKAVHERHIRFAYVPVPHGEIPDEAVIALERAIHESHGPVLLYCRSGRRAARTWSLAEASRSGGLDAEAIISSVRASGQSSSDLRDQIVRRIVARTQRRGAIRE